MSHAIDGPTPDAVEDDPSLTAIYRHLWRNGATCPGLMLEDVDVTVGTLYNRIEDLEEADLATQVKDPRNPCRTVLVPHYGPHGATPEEWLAEVVYGDR